MFTTRLMQPTDADAVRALDVRAFAPYIQRFAGTHTQPPRRRENVLACLALNPGGCFVAEEDGQLLGHIFSRRWGTLGWIGVFGVDPSQQGQGVGRALLGRAAAQLESAGCALIGLETMPDCDYNVGLYTRAGFRPVHSTLTLYGAAGSAARPPAYTPLSRAGEAGLAAVAAISGAALPGLDYTVEAGNALEFGWGEGLLVGEPEPWAVAVVRTVNKREGPAGSLADVLAMAVRPEARGRVVQAACAVEAFARDRGLAEVHLAVNAADWPTLQRLLAAGYRVWHLGLRLLRKSDYAYPPGVELSRWSM